MVRDRVKKSLLNELYSGRVGVFFLFHEFVDYSLSVLRK